MLTFILLCFILVYGINTQSVTIVVASKHENLDWIHKYLKGYDVKIYRADSNITGYYSLYEKGFEACQYLAYIINNYHNLSDYTIFIHAHSQSWHFRGQMYDLIPRLDYSKLEFANLNYECYQKVVFDQRYNRLIESLYNKSIPSISHYCCAQFVVTRDRILRNSLETYQAYDYWLQTIKEENHYTSRVFEYTYHMIFGNSQYEEPYKNGVCDLIDCNPEELKQKKILYTYRLNEDGEKIQHNIH
jgi:hypothetical protein